MRTVLLADDDRNLVDVLSKKIGADPAYKIVAQLYDGQNALEQIRLLRPDIIILDIVMPGSDGVYVVEHIRRHMSGYHPVIYILSGIGTSTIMKTLNALDIDFFSMKPVALEVILQNLKTVVGRPEKAVLPKSAAGRAQADFKPVLRQVEVLTRQLGMSPHRKSTKCVNEALIYCIENPESTELITKNLYPAIAKKHGLSSSAVERDIRYAIRGIQKAKTPTYDKIFFYAGDKKITSGEFLTVVSDYLAMHLL